MPWWVVLILVFVVLIAAVAVHDLVQKKHAILRNYPVVGHLRYVLEKVGPELRQYIVTGNDEELPFTRDQRRWVYTSAKDRNTYFGFGTDTPVDEPGHVVIHHTAFPLSETENHSAIPSAKVLGAWGDRAHAFRPASVVNISAMSFGSLSGQAVEALNRGAASAGCLHNTGEGGISQHHRHGGDLILQVGTGYFGCRDGDGNFSMDALLSCIDGAPVRAIEIKLSQGAKPGLGGLLPAAKVSPAIAEARGVPVGITVASPARHRAFDDMASMVDFVEAIASETGLPVGIKAAVGQLNFWEELAGHMASAGRGPDFITIDGGEGGTGAAPLVFTDHVAYPFRTAMARVYGTFAAVGLQQQITFIGSGKLGYPQNAMAAFVLGCDMVNVAREAMLAIGCIQAQKCHTDHCPTGVATQNKRLARALEPTSKGVRCTNYIENLRHELLRVSHAAGATHPAFVPAEAVEIVDAQRAVVPMAPFYGLTPGLQRLSPKQADDLAEIMVLAD